MELESKDDAYLKLKLEADGKIHISFSEFSLYSQCGHKHLLVKYLKLVTEPPSIHLYFGNAIHAAIEHSIKDGIGAEKRVAFFRENFTKEMTNNMKSDPSFSELGHFLEQGENILRILNVEKIFEKYKIVAVEEPLYENLFGKYFFKGFIDLIVQDRVTGEYVIIDWKTSGEEWDVPKKKKDEIFMCQMRFYKYFYARKHNIPLDQIQCRYVVLNRLKSKKNPKGGFGSLQRVDIDSTEDEMKFSLIKLATAVKNIHILKEFKKSKYEVDSNGKSKEKDCFFCQFKNNVHPMCNRDDEQYVGLLEEHKKE